MAKSYSRASSDVERTIERMREQYHPHLRVAEANFHVTVSALFVFDLESTEPVLKHQGYPAAAVIKISSLKERALGLADAVMVIDRAHWIMLTPAQRDALIDHELYHIEVVLDDETGGPVFDALDRPKLEMRMHDRQFGWFDAIARRHGESSIEVRQAKYLLAETQQLYFNFGPTPEPAANDADELVERAIVYVRQMSQVGTLQLQERFEIGHTTATRLMNVLQERGVIGHVRPSGKHDVLPKPDAKVHIDAKGNVSGSHTVADGTRVEISGRVAVPDGVPDDDTLDEMYPKAVEFVQSSGKASISAVQRACTIGYNRAARLFEAMERQGIVSRMQADGTRTVLVARTQQAAAEAAA